MSTLSRLVRWRRLIIGRLKILTPLLLAAMVLGLTGRSVELTLPMVLSSAADAFALTNRQLGLFAMAEVLGVTLASASSVWWLRHTRPAQLAMIGVLAFVVGNAITPFVSPDWLIPVRFLTALLGEGALLIVATSLLGSAAQASRVYALYMAAQMVLGALLLGLQGELASRFSLLGVMASLVGLGLITLLALPGVSRASNRDPDQPTGAWHSGQPTRRATLLLVAMGLFHVGVGGAWAFLQQRGVQLGLDFGTGGWMMSFIMLSGLAGTGLAALGGSALGYRLPFWLGSIGLAVGSALAGLVDNLLWFAAGGTLIMVGWNLVVPYQIAALGRRGPVAGQLALVPACQGAGLAAGPMLVGWLAGDGHFAAMAGVSAISAALALMAGIGGLRMILPDEGKGT